MAFDPNVVLLHSWYTFCCGNMIVRHNSCFHLGRMCCQPKRKRVRKPRYPKDFDPENPGPKPDPERWMPKWQRSGRKKGGRRRDEKKIKGSQVWVLCSGDDSFTGLHSTYICGQFPCQHSILLSLLNHISGCREQEKSMNLWTEQRQVQVSRALLVETYHQGLSGQVGLGRGGVVESEQHSVELHSMSMHSVKFSQSSFILFILSDSAFVIERNATCRPAKQALMNKPLQETGYVVPCICTGTHEVQAPTLISAIDSWALNKPKVLLPLQLISIMLLSSNIPSNLQNPQLLISKQQATAWIFPRHLEAKAVS